MQPSEPPPTYEEAAAHGGTSPSTLRVPGHTRNGIPPQIRRSMEDESRPVPEGWVRQYDTGEEHQYFVDTTTDPPRSIWHHPYDDDQYMSSLTPEERNRIEGLHQTPAEADFDNSDEFPTELPPRPADEPTSTARGLGRRMKNALTHSTHEEREARRRERDEKERRAYQTHLRIRAAMAKAEETGEPQLVGKDSEGMDVYVEPRSGPGDGWAGGYGGGAYGYNPFMQGPYGMPNNMFMRPSMPYGRPLGYGYGRGGYGGYGGFGGFGAPMMGLGGGMMLGGLLL